MKGVTLLNILPSDPLGEFVLPNSGLCRLRNPGSQPGNASPRGHCHIKLWLPPGQFGLLVLRHQQTRKGVTISAGSLTLIVRKW